MNKRPARVVIFKLNFFGDNVVFVPSLQALRTNFPDWHITLITVPNLVDLYRGPLGPQEILTSPKFAFNKSHRRPWVLASWIWRIRRRRPDACLVSFDQGSAAHLVARLSGAPIRIGGYMSRLRVPNTLTEEVRAPEDERPVTWSWRMADALARSLGEEGGLPGEPPPPDFRHLYSRRPRADNGRKRVVIHSGASRPLNQWPMERFATVATALARDLDVTWISHGGTTGPTPHGAKQARVNSVGDLADLLANADLFLGNNSGPMHLANALGCPGVAVTGLSAKGWDPYWFRDRWSVLRHPGLYCAPCEKLTTEVTACANTGSPKECFMYWTPPAVEAACRFQLGQTYMRI